MKSGDTKRGSVLMFGWEFPPHNSGGLGVACYGLARALTRRGARVYFVLPRPVDLGSPPCDVDFAGGEDEWLDMEALDVLLSPYTTEDSYDSARVSRGGAHQPYRATLYDEVMRYGELARGVTRRRFGEFDVIHAHDWLSFPAGIAAQQESGAPLIVHVHATEFDRGGGNSVNQRIYDIERAGMEAADLVIAVSQFTKDIITSRYGIPAEKVAVVHNGIDAEDYTEEKTTSERVIRLKERGHKVVLFVGRLTLQKGPDYFVEAAKRVATYVPEAVFVVAGSGDMRGRMLERAAELGIADRFIFAGFLRGAELWSVYKAADLYIMPSVSEPFGITPLEALINGTPAIVSRQSGVSEIIKHALKVDFWDIDQIVNKAVSVLSYPTLQNHMRAHGNREVYQHGWDVAAEKCLGLYATMSAVH